MKRFLVFLMLAVLGTLCACGEAEDPLTTFRVSVTDDGAAVSGADVYLYDFQAGEIVTAGATDRQGGCTLSYMPEAEEEGTVFYRDFLIYVDKEGYLPASYSLTQYYGGDGEEDKEEIDADFSIPLTPASQAETLPEATAGEDMADLEAQYGKQPFYVIGEKAP